MTNSHTAKLTREQIEKWRAAIKMMWLGVSEADVLCDMALSSLQSETRRADPSGGDHVYPWQRTYEDGLEDAAKCADSFYAGFIAADYIYVRDVSDAIRALKKADPLPSANGSGESRTPAEVSAPCVVAASGEFDRGWDAAVEAVAAAMAREDCSHGVGVEIAAKIRRLNAGNHERNGA